jgi:hypothetical protein
LQEQTQSIDGLLRLSLKDYVGGNLLYLAHEQVKSARVLFSRGIGSQSAGGQKLEPARNSDHTSELLLCKYPQRCRAFLHLIRKFLLLLRDRFRNGEIRGRKCL